MLRQTFHHLCNLLLVSKKTASSNITTTDPPTAADNTGRHANRFLYHRGLHQNKTLTSTDKNANEQDWFVN